MIDADPERAGRPDSATRVGRYRILERIGQGATAAVYRAHDEETGWPVALKLLLTDLEAEDQIRTRFLREVEIARVLRHRNLVTVYDAGELDGRFFLAMELLDGVTLRDHLLRHPALPLEGKLDLMIQLCEGLAVAHDHGIYHRDLKPSNLFVRDDGSLKILDFGIARLASSSMTVAGLLMGTPDFMSPEQARGADIDHRSDIFSVGAVLYFLLSGRKPFPGAQLPNVLHKVEHEDPIALAEAEAPPVMSRIVTRALAKAPAARHPTVRTLLRDLIECRRTFAAATRTLSAHAREQAKDAAAQAVRVAELTRVLEAPEAPPADDLFVATGLAARHPRHAERGPALLSWAPLTRALAVDMDETLSAFRAERRQAADRLAPAVDALTAARQAIEAGDTSLAIEHAERVLAACPASAAARRLADDARAQASVLGAAARRSRASDAIAHARRAVARGDWSSAEGHLGRARELDPESPDLAAVRDELQAKRSGAEAQRVARERQHKAEIDALVATAEEALARGETGEALRAVKAVHAREPGEARAERIRVQAAAAAQAESQRAERTARLRAHLDRGRSLSAAGRFDEARAEAERALSIEMGHAEARQLMADAARGALGARRQKTAARVAVRSVRASRAFLDHAGRALLLGDLERARAAAETALAIDPTSADARGLVERTRQAIDELGDGEPWPTDADPEATQILLLPRSRDGWRERLGGRAKPAAAATPSAAAFEAFRLRIERATAPARHLDLAARRYRVGRALDNEIVLDDPGHTISRLHAELQPAGGGYLLVDCQSDNGVWLDGERVERVALEVDIPVVIGPYQLVLEGLAHTPRPRPAPTPIGGRR